ncbi:RNA-binding protein, putative, UPB1 [Leishmania donovani]|uniref:RNA-binding protein, putative, UPB1 n=1 Tax=Leishmania donovani TaxID=5661 RepID=E9BHF4_LEIDO|nr:RNA-binding protein, putative, UPB1 [Leishmania donovani]CBZ34680.1 RNA-binding protein, putative, UPB1 [Leishmania donovani]
MHAPTLYHRQILCSLLFSFFCVFAFSTSFFAQPRAAPFRLCQPSLFSSFSLLH